MTDDEELHASFYRSEQYKESATERLARQMDEVGSMFLVALRADVEKLTRRPGVDALGFPDVPLTGYLIECSHCGHDGPHEELQWPGNRKSLRCTRCHGNFQERLNS